MNAALFLKNRGHYMISIKANCVDSTQAPEHVFAQEVQKMREEKLRPITQMTLEPVSYTHLTLPTIYSV